MPNAARFRVYAKNFSLTYSNIQQQEAEFSKEDLHEHLCQLRGVTWAEVSKELHQDGNTHFHALVVFNTRTNIRDVAFFDYQGVHPNIQGCRNLQAWRNYIRKDGDFCGGPDDEAEGGAEDLGPRFSYCRQCTTLEEWIEYCIQEKIQHAYCKWIWDLVHAPNDPSTIEEAPQGGEMWEQLREFRYDDFTRKCLVLVGPTGCGKTTWALTYAPKPCLLVSHMDDLKKFDPSKHKSIVFDDMDFKHFPVTGQIHLVDQFQPRSIHCRYTVSSIPASTPKIFTANERPFADDPPISRRIRLINIERPWGHIEIN